MRSVEIHVASLVTQLKRDDVEAAREELTQVRTHTCMHARTRAQRTSKGRKKEQVEEKKEEKNSVPVYVLLWVDIDNEADAHVPYDHVSQRKKEEKREGKRESREEGHKTVECG
jgi:choline kinase